MPRTAPWAVGSATATTAHKWPQTASMTAAEEKLNKNKRKNKKKSAVYRLARWRSAFHGLKVASRGGPGPGPGPASQVVFTPMLSTREREGAAGPSCECFGLQQRLDAAGSVPMDIAAAVDI